MVTESQPVAREERDTGPTIREVLAVVVLSVTAVLTAWSGFESSKWGGEMSISFSQASTARMEASRYAAQADAARNFDLNVFAVYVQAVAEDDERLREFVETRFTDHFAVAFDEWMQMAPLQNADAPNSPFALSSYQPPGQMEAEDADARADQLFNEALRNNQRGDDYTLLTVLFALVLFFTALSQQIRAARLGVVVLVGASALMLTGIGFLMAFPKII